MLALLRPVEGAGGLPEVCASGLDVLECCELFSAIDRANERWNSSMQGMIDNSTMESDVECT